MSQSQPKIIPEKILIRGIQITNAQVNAAPGASSTWDELTLTASGKIAFNEEYICRISLQLDMERPGVQDHTPLIQANFALDFDFEVENMLELISVDNESKMVTNVPYELGATLMGIAYSTARGIIMTRTAGTVLNGLILPVVNPMTLLEQGNHSGNK